MPVVVRRWQVVLLKKFLLAKYEKLSAAHGAFATSSLIVIWPWLVFITMSRVPECGRFVAGGVPVFTRSGSFGAAGLAVGSGFGAHLHVAGFAALAPALGVALP